MARVLYAGRRDEGHAWEAALRAAHPGIDLTMEPDGADPETVDILLYAPSGPVKDLSPYSGVAAIQSLWAGVETLMANPTLPDQVPVLRMVEDGMRDGMTDYVTGHALRLHLEIDAQRERQARGEWVSKSPPLSSDRRVGIVGLGELGRDAASMLAALRFDVSGWSRSAKEIPGVRCLHGADGFRMLLAESDILVLLAPHTAETEDLMDGAAFAAMKRGAHVINAARGHLIDDGALLAALESGQVGSATLDVFREEPLPSNHPYWDHPSVTITPHIASATRKETAARLVSEQIGRFGRGEAFLHVVDRKSGY